MGASAYYYMKRTHTFLPDFIQNFIFGFDANLPQQPLQAQKPAEPLRFSFPLRIQPELVVDRFHHKRDGKHGIRFCQVQIPHHGFQIPVDKQQRPSDQGSQHRTGHAVGMVKGQGGKYPFFCGHIDTGIAGIVENRLVTQHNRFGQAGGAGGEHNGRRLSCPDWRIHGRPVFGKTAFPLFTQPGIGRNPAVPGIPQQDEQLDAILSLGNILADGQADIGSEYGFRLSHLQHLPDTFVRLFRINANRRPPAGGHSQIGDDPRIAVFAYQSDIFPCKPAGAEGCPQLSHLFRQFPVASAFFRLVSAEPGYGGLIPEGIFYPVRKRIKGIIIGYFITWKIFHRFSPPSSCSFPVSYFWLKLSSPILSSISRKASTT